MKRAVVLTALGVWLAALAAARVDGDLKPLFNGKDLTGWEVVGAKSWEVKDGVVACSGEGSGWLRSAKEYENFILRLEFKISPTGNSGVFVRCAPTGRSSRSGMEIQILDDAGKPATKTSTASIYECLAPRVNANKPAGEWNQEQIECRGRQVRVTLNGQLVQDVNLDDPAVAENGPKGFPLGKRRQKGHIGLQNHHSAVEFRGVEIEEL